MATESGGFGKNITRSGHNILDLTKRFEAVSYDTTNVGRALYLCATNLNREVSA